MSPDSVEKMQDRIIHVPVITREGEPASRFSTSDKARFWAKVNKTDTCWLWTGTLFGSLGYGAFSMARGLPRGKQAPEYAHRVAWELTHGPIPDGLQVLHHCDVPRCVRPGPEPGHTFLGTHKTNMEDAARKGRLHVSRPKRQTVTDDTLRTMRDMRAAGSTLQVIADTVGVSKTYVSLVVRGLRRQHRQPRLRRSA